VDGGRGRDVAVVVGTKAVVGKCRWLDPDISYVILAPFLRYGDFLAENSTFLCPPLIRRSRSICSVRKFVRSKPCGN